MTHDETMEELATFAKKLIESQTPLPEEFQQVIDDHWWELLDDD
jgi:hypothetical protein